MGRLAPLFIAGSSAHPQKEKGPSLNGRGLPDTFARKTSKMERRTSTIPGTEYGKCKGQLGNLLRGREGGVARGESQRKRGIQQGAEASLWPSTSPKRDRPQIISDRAEAYSTKLNHSTENSYINHSNTYPCY